LLRVGEVLPQREHLFALQINKQAFRYDEYALALLRDTGKQLATRGDVRKIERDALQPAARLCCREDLFFVSQQRRQVYFDPAQLSRQLQPKRTRIESACKVQHC